jgi:hypothetical protein
MGPIAVRKLYQEFMELGIDHEYSMIVISVRKHAVSHLKQFAKG